jgi:hypothetical protein
VYCLRITQFWAAWFSVRITQQSRLNEVYDIGDILEDFEFHSLIASR